MACLALVVVNELSHLLLLVLLLSLLDSSLHVVKFLLSLLELRQNSVAPLVSIDVLHLDFGVGLDELLRMDESSSNLNIDIAALLDLKEDFHGTEFVDATRLPDEERLKSIPVWVFVKEPCQRQINLIILVRNVDILMPLNRFLLLDQLLNLHMELCEPHDVGLLKLVQILVHVLLKFIDVLCIHILNILNKLLIFELLLILILIIIIKLVLQVLRLFRKLIDR